MKKIIFVGAIALSFSAMAEKIDYKYCKMNFNTPVGVDNGGFPFKLEDDGKITPHKDVKYSYDEKSKTETIEFEGKEEWVKGMKGSVIIKRNDKGDPVQVIQNSEFPGVKSESGVGSKNRFGPYGGFGMGYPGVGIGGGGFGGFGYMGPSKSSVVTDIKIKDKKCFPHRNISLMEMGNHTHKSFISDVELCYDVMKMAKEEAKEGSDANKLRQCYDSYQKKAGAILGSHLKRNDDLYNPKREKEDDYQSPWGSGGYFGDLEGGGFGTGEPAKGGYPGGGGGYAHAGGFAGSIDNIVQSEFFTPAEKVKILRQYCSFPYGPMAEMLKDESLFKKEVTSEPGGEGSGGGAKDTESK